MPDTSSKQATASQTVLFPAYTWDYSVKNGKVGLGLVANRNMKKGELVFSDSLEFMLADVVEGDSLLFDRCEKASGKHGSKVPHRLPLTREMLLRTHGVPALKPDPTGQSAGIVSWQLEVPGMLMNHSCDPNVSDDSHDAAKGEGFAARDIKKGEELTYNYVLQYYDQGPFFEECKCGGATCRGKMMGFKALSSAEKELFFPSASKAVQAMHKADVGQGPPVERKQVMYPERIPSPDADKVLRLVFPGPSHALADIVVKQTETGKFGLYALRDFSFGERVYEFWCQGWPLGGKTPVDVDIVFSESLTKSDPPQGTVVRVNALECASRDRIGRFMFSGWDLFTAHSCEPNLVYNDKDEYEDDDWRGAFAAREIKEGEQLTIDFNCILWDRSECEDMDTCDCGAKNCTGIMKGFKFLPRKAQEERKVMTWRGVGPPYDGERGKVTLGEALAPHVRVSWRKDSEQKDDAPETGSSSSSSSDESSSDESSDEE